MPSLYISLLGGLLATLFVLLTVHRRNDAWWLLASLFTITAAIIRVLIPVDAVRDFEPYLRSFEQVKYGAAVPEEMLFEPYRLILFESIVLFGDLDSLAQIGIAYYLHFAVATGFFLWLAYQESVPFEAKVILFLAFYPPIAFVWIQAGMAYVAACFLFLILSSAKRARALRYLPILVHASVAPFLVIMKAKDYGPWLRMLAIGATVVVGYFLLDSSYAQYIAGKLDRYSETSDRRTSFDLVLFHLANILAFSVLALLSAAFRRNFALWSLMGIYMAMYFVNPVVGLRVFPLVLIACIVQRIPFDRYRHVTFWVTVAYSPVFFVRFDQIFGVL